MHWGLGTQVCLKAGRQPLQESKHFAPRIKFAGVSENKFDDWGGRSQSAGSATVFKELAPLPQRGKVDQHWTVIVVSSHRVDLPHRRVPAVSHSWPSVHPLPSFVVPRRPRFELRTIKDGSAILTSLFVTVHCDAAATACDDAGCYHHALVESCVTGTTFVVQCSRVGITI